MPQPKDPAYLSTARRDIGQRETLGPNDSPFLRKMLERLGLSWLIGQPWCGSIMRDWFERSGLSAPPKAYRALSWATYGVACAGPLHGAIAVMTRKGGGHVGIVTGVSASGSHVRVLGGNQDNMVCEAWFPAARITAYRLPVGAQRQAAVIAKVGEMSTSEA